MDDDGHMMRTPRLKEFAKKHGLHIITVQSLIEYRKRTENFVHEVADVDFPSKYGHFRIHAYENELNNKCDIAIVKGDVRGKKDVLVRVHSECLTGDALGSMRCRTRAATQSKPTSSSASRRICATTASAPRFSQTLASRASA